MAAKSGSTSTGDTTRWQALGNGHVQPAVVLRCDRCFHGPLQVSCNLRSSIQGVDDQNRKHRQKRLTDANRPVCTWPATLRLQPAALGMQVAQLDQVGRQPPSVPLAGDKHALSYSGSESLQNTQHAPKFKLLQHHALCAYRLSASWNEAARPGQL